MLYRSFKFIPTVFLTLQRSYYIGIVLSRCKPRIEAKKCLKRYFCSLSNIHKPIIASTTDTELHPHSNNFETIYKNPHIVHAKVINRVKLFQTVICCLFGPASIYSYANGIIGLQILSGTIFFGTFSLVMLYIMGEFFRKFIGFVYYNDKEDTIKIAHLTFFGKRNDVVIPVADIIPFAEGGNNPSNVFYRVQQYSEPGVSYYLSTKYGGVKDKKIFDYIFGKF